MDLQYFFLGERDASKSFTAAYDTTLKPHHNWFVQKAFTVGLKMVPDFQGFVDAMTGPDFKGDKVRQYYFFWCKNNAWKLRKKLSYVKWVNI